MACCGAKTSPCFAGNKRQFFLGHDPQAQNEYGIGAADRERLLATLRQAATLHGAQVLADRARLSRRHLASILKDGKPATPAMLAHLGAAAAALEADHRQATDQAGRIIEQVRRRCMQTGLRSFATAACVNQGHLSRILAGARTPSQAILARLAQAVDALPG